MHESSQTAQIRHDQAGGAYMLPAWDQTMYAAPIKGATAASLSVVRRIIRMTFFCTLFLVTLALFSYWVLPASKMCMQAPFCL